MIHLGQVIVHERGKNPYEHGISGHYRRWLLGRFRTGTMPADYAAWYDAPHGVPKRELRYDDKPEIDFSPLDNDPQPFLMKRDDDPLYPGKPWIVLSARGEVRCHCETPHLAEQVIGKLILEQLT